MAKLVYGVGVTDININSDQALVCDLASNDLQVSM